MGGFLKATRPARRLPVALQEPAKVANFLGFALVRLLMAFAEHHVQRQLINKVAIDPSTLMAAQHTEGGYRDSVFTYAAEIKLRCPDSEYVEWLMPDELAPAAGVGGGGTDAPGAMGGVAAPQPFAANAVVVGVAAAAPVAGAGGLGAAPV